MLAIALRRSNRAPYGIVQPPQLALGSAVHVPHASHDSMRLVVQIQAVCDQLLQFDLRRTFKRTATTGTAAFSTVASTVVPATLAASFGTATALPLATRTRIPAFTARRTILRRTVLPRRAAALALPLRTRLSLW